MSTDTLENAANNIWTRIFHRLQAALTKQKNHKSEAVSRFWQYAENSSKADYSSFHGIL